MIHGYLASDIPGVIDAERFLLSLVLGSNVSLRQRSRRTWRLGEVMEPFLEILERHGALVVFGTVLAEQIGLPLPALPLLVAAGILIGTGHMGLGSTLLAAFLAALLADIAWYVAGRRRGRGVLGWLCRIALEPDSCVKRTEDFFLKHGPHSLVVAKFVPGLSTIAPPLAGIVGLGLPAFLFYDGLGAAIWAGSSVGLGYMFSDRVEQALAYGNHLAPVAAVALLGTLAAYVAFKAVRRRRLGAVPRITVEELTEKLRMDEPPLVIDVRPKVVVDVEPGIPSAWAISLDELVRRHRELPRHRELVLYCACPDDVASAQGALLLQQKGFTHARPLAGGLQAWRRHAGRIEKSSAPAGTPVTVAMAR